MDDKRETETSQTRKERKEEPYNRVCTYNPLLAYIFLRYNASELVHFCQHHGYGHKALLLLSHRFHHRICTTAAIVLASTCTSATAAAAAAAAAAATTTTAATAATTAAAPALSVRASLICRVSTCKVISNESLFYVG
jgi:hypothetical protein